MSEINVVFDAAPQGHFFSEDYTCAWTAVHPWSPLLVLVAGRRDLVGVGEGEEEGFGEFAAGGGVERGREGDGRVASEEIAVFRSDQGEGGSLMIAMFVESLCCKSVSVN
jgi:hypothetical protein